MSPVSFAETEIKIDDRKKYIMNRWWTREELLAEAENIFKKTSRHSASGRAKILEALK